MKTTRHHRKKGKRGYRLHDERIAYSGGTGSMRSIKYELVDTSETIGLRDKVAHAITSDYRMLYGPINFDEYLTNKHSPSLLHFWLKALSLGFVFSNQNSIENEFLQYLGQKTIWQRCFDDLRSELQEVIDPVAFQEFLIKSHRGVEQKSNEQRRRIILNLAPKDTQSDELFRVAGRWVEEFRLDQDQLAFKCEIFGIAKPDVPKRDMSLSWALDPNFEVIEIADRTEFLDKIIKLYETKPGAVQAKRFLAIGDNGNYMGGVFGNLLGNLQHVDTAKTAQFLTQTYGFADSQVIRDRLNDLKVLADEIAPPMLVKQWSDYRSDFNGTIESWYSNRTAKQQITLEQLDGKENPKEKKKMGGLLQLLESIGGALRESSEISDGILKETLSFVRSHGERIDRKFTVELDSYLAKLRTDLNEFMQQHKDVKLPRDWQSQLSKHVQSSPLFFGEQKYALWEQLLQLKSLIRTEVEKLEEVLSQSFSDYEISEKQVDMLAQLFVRITSGGNGEVIDKLRKIEQALGVNFSERTEKARFFKTEGGYERAKFITLPIPRKIMVSELVRLADLQELYHKIKISPQDNYILRDTAQLSKIVVSALVRGSEKERTVVLFHSNLSGYANLISKNKFISRATVQAINGSQLVMGISHNRYRYSFLADKFTQRGEVTQFGKTYNLTSADLKTKPTTAPVLEVASSRYQVQFLDWFMGKHKRKKTWLGAGGAFSIAEKTVEIDWSAEQPRIANVTDLRVFVSQPFEIKQKSDNQPTTVANNRFIGVDIGEYGLAWSLIEVNEDNVSQVDSGFIDDNQQQKLKSAVRNLRESQVRATFNSPDTRIARIRESLIGAYRNQLEDLAMRLNARLSFEYEVSGFETGGNRIAKVYDSIKRGDVHKKENNAENKMAWGDRGTNNWGLETTAAGTSQTCSKCHRWTSLKIDDTQDYELVPYDDNLLKTTIADGEVRLLGKKDAGNMVSGKELKGMIYKAMRPNMDGLGMKIVERKLGAEEFKKMQEEFGVDKKRGNMAIYICPYTDCHHVSDADLQAAFNIAVRGYLKSINPVRAKKTGNKGLNAEFLVDKASKLRYNPIGLEHEDGNPGIDPK